MLNKNHKLIEIKTKALVDSLYVGNYKTKHKGRGIEFADFREYNFGDNVKNIDFIKSEKEGKVLLRLYEEERELSVYFIIDLNKSYLEKYNTNITKKDILFEIIYLIGLSVIKDGNKLGALINNQDNKLFFAKKGKQNFINIVNYIEKIILTSRSSGTFVEKGGFKRFLNFLNNSGGKNEFIEGSLKYFNSLKIKNSLVFYINDKLDFDLKDLKILTTKNDLIFCNIFNSFENNLSGEGLVGIDNIDLKIDLGNKEKVKKYRELRNKKIIDLRQIILKYGGKHLLLDETKNIYKEFYKLFKI